MKRMLLFAVLLITNQLTAQNCPNGFTAMNQGALDNFATLYPNCTTINGDLFVAGSVENVNALSQITTVNGNVTLSSNNPNFNLTGLSALTTIGGSLNISSAVSDLTGLHNVSSIGQSLRIQSCTNLTDLSPLNGIHSIGANIEVTNNVALTDFNILNNMTSIPGFINFSDNVALSSVSGLNALSNIDGYLRFAFNYQLASIAGFSALENIGNYLFISLATALTSLTGLESLTTVGQYITLNNNENLTSVEALNHPIFIGSYINFINNSQLSDCAVESVCNAIENPDIQVSMVSNAPGCNSINQVEAACDCAGQELDYSNSITWCGPYTFLNQTFEESGTYEIPFTNVNGCSGTATLYLTLVEIEYNVTVDDSTFTVSGNFQNVTWLDCQNGFEPIAGAIFSTFEGSSTGSYAAVLELTGCSVQTDCFQFQETGEPSGITNLEINMFRLFPNPSSGILRMEAIEHITGSLSLSVNNLFGQQVAFIPSASQSATIDLSHLPAGTYFMVIKHEKGQVLQRLVILGDE